MKGEEPWTVQKLRKLLEKHITAMEMAGGESYLSHQLQRWFLILDTCTKNLVTPL